MLTYASECNMRFIFRVILFSSLFSRVRSTSGNNRKLNDEKNKSHIARAKRHTLKDLSYDTNKPGNSKKSDPVDRSSL